MFSLGYLYTEVVVFLNRAKSNVNMPIRPINMSKTRSSFDKSVNRGVIPSDNPTVPKAETHSNSIFSAPLSGSISYMINEEHPKITIERIIIAKALSTERS